MSWRTSRIVGLNGVDAAGVAGTTLARLTYSYKAAGRVAGTARQLIPNLDLHSRSTDCRATSALPCACWYTRLKHRALVAIGLSRCHAAGTAYKRFQCSFGTPGA